MKRIILVTGANRGIGLEICNQLAAKGHEVILGSRDEDKGKLVASALPKNVHPVKLEITNPNDLKNVRRFITEKFRHLDVLINNAGIGVGSKGAINADFEEVKEIMETNFFGAWYMIKAMLPLLAKSKDGRIINVSSNMGALKNLDGGYAGYSLSKAALNSLTILLSNELKDKNIKVNALNPGWVKTDMGGPNAPRSVQEGADSAVWLSTEKNIPSGKFIKDRKVIDW